jgi:DNA-binding NarL/FixJ family response regulator
MSRQELALLLRQEGVTVCWEAGLLVEAVERLPAARADLAVVDLSVDGKDGLPLITELRAQGVPVLVHSLQEGPLGIERALAAGAAGYVSKREPTETVVAAIGEVLAGRVFVSPRAARSLAGWWEDRSGSRGAC